METQTSRDVLTFWFPDLTGADHARLVKQFQWWFGGGSDEAVASRYPALTDRATGGELDAWSEAPRSRLALIIVLDQFSRSLYRNTPRAFAQDTRAVQVTLEGFDMGHYAALETPWEKTFFFLPLGHSEHLPYHERAVTLAEELVANAPAAFRKVLEHSASQARAHRDVIARFGRHPHRNAILGRTSSAAELVYLATTQLVHTRTPEP